MKCNKHRHFIYYSAYITYSGFALLGTLHDLPQSNINAMYSVLQYCTMQGIHVLSLAAAATTDRYMRCGVGSRIHTPSRGIISREDARTEYSGPSDNGRVISNLNTEPKKHNVPILSHLLCLLKCPADILHSSVSGKPSPSSYFNCGGDNAIKGTFVKTPQSSFRRMSKDRDKRITKEAGFYRASHCRQFTACHVVAIFFFFVV